MEKRDRNILIGVGVAFVVSAASYEMNAYHYQSLEENAKYKTIKNAGGPAGMLTLPKGMPGGPNGTKAEKSSTAAADPQASAAVKKTDTAPEVSAAKAAAAPVAPPAAPVVETVSTLPMLMTAPVAPLEYVAPMASLSPPSFARQCAVDEGSSFLNLRYKHLLFRLNLRRGLTPRSSILAGASGHARETIVSDDLNVTCRSSHCYEISPQLVSMADGQRSNVHVFNCEEWFLVGDEDGPGCEKNASPKVLSMTNAPGHRCVIGMLKDMRVFEPNLKTAKTDAGSARYSSVYMTQRLPASERMPASFDSNR